MNPLRLPLLLGLIVPIVSAREYPDYESFRQWILREEIVGTSSGSQLEERIGDPLILGDSDSVSLGWFDAVAGMGPACGEIFLLRRAKDGLDTWSLGSCWIREWEEKPARFATFRPQVKIASSGRIVYFETLRLDDVDSESGDMAYSRLLWVFSIQPWGIAQVGNELVIGNGSAEGNRLTNACALGYSFTDSTLEIKPSSRSACKSLNSVAKSHRLSRATESIPSVDSIFADAANVFKAQGASMAMARIDSTLTVESWKIHPRHVGYINDLGYYLEQANRTEKAIFVLMQVVKQYPTRTPAYLNLADAYQKSGDEAKAKANYQKYVDLMEKAGKGSKVPTRVRSILKP